MAYFQDVSVHEVNTGALTRSSFANCADGRVIAVWDDGNKIYQGYALDYADLMTVDSIDGATDISFDNATYFNMRASVFNMGEDLFLAYARDHRESSGEQINGLFLYKSPSGNGGDWTLHSTLQTVSYTGWLTAMQYLVQVGAGIIGASGRWFLCAPFDNQYSSARSEWVCGLWYSDNDGETWTLSKKGSSYYDTYTSHRPFEFNNTLYWLRSNSYSGGSTILYASADDGATWATGVRLGYFTSLCMWTADDGYVYAVQPGSSYAMKVWKTNGALTPFALAPTGSWEFVVDVLGADDSPTPDGTYQITELGGVQTISRGAYVSKTGLALQTRKQYVLVEQVDSGGSMTYDGKNYRYIQTLEAFDITTHASAGVSVTYEYGGASVIYDAITYLFLASGITDPTAEGGFGSYTADTSRTVQSLADREVFVNFYYILPSLTVTTDSIADETLNGFTTNITLTSNAAEMAITHAGFVWGTSTEPTLETAAYIDLGAVAYGSHAPAYAGADVQPDTTYYVRGFAVTDYGTYYGNELTFSVAAVLATVTTDLVDTISKTGFSVQESITALGDKSVTFGFVWATTATPRIDGEGVTKVEIGSMTTPRTIRYNHTATVVVDQTYYLAAYATNSAGTAYGDDVSFTLASAFTWEFIATPDHDRLNNLDQDNHTQYHTDARGDARYLKKTDGADQVGVDPIEGLTGDTVQAILEALKDYVDEFSGEIFTPTEVSFTNEATWTVNHNLGRLPIVTIWEETAGLVGFGTAPFGTSAFGGTSAILTVGDPEAAVVTQQGLNTMVVTWSSPKTGKVVYV